MANAHDIIVKAQLDAIHAQLDVLHEFNRKVDRLEATGFWRRFEDETPNVIIKFDSDVKMQRTGAATFSMAGRVTSWLQDFDQDEIDAFVLTFRMFTQNNDRISLHNLSKIYASPWMTTGGNATECFEDARNSLNEHLDSLATIMFGDYSITIRTIADIVIYGGLAHTNAEKSEMFQSWQASGIMGFIWAEFYAYARHAMETLQYIRGLNASLLDMIERHGFKIEPPSP